jgi:DNA-binding GntR family transcriptional regulator
MMTICQSRTGAGTVEEPVEPDEAQAAPRALNRVSTIDAVAASLRERVVGGEFLPGTRLPEIDLAVEYGIARPTVRAALQQLTLTGLLHREANRSAFVPELSPDDVLDLFATRKLIESDVVRRLTKGPCELGAVDAALARLERFNRDARWSDVVEADLEFHRSLATATCSPRLLRLFGVLEDEIRLAIAQLRPIYASPSELAREHKTLLKTIRSRRTRDAVELMQRHLDAAVEDLTAPRMHVPGR